MRHKAASPEALDPLPVFDEAGAAFEPEAASPAAAAITWRDVVESVRDVLASGTEVRTTAPWVAVEPVRPAARRSKFLAAFSRMIAVDPTQLLDLPAWWQRSETAGRVRISRRLWLGPPQPEANGTWRLSGRLRSAWLLRSIPVDLLLWPHLGAWTKLALEPQRRVHVGHRYFAKGHRVLDKLSARLATELEPVAT